MVSFLRRIVVFMLAIALAISSAGGSMAGLRMSGHDHSPVNSSSVADASHSQTHAHEPGSLLVDDLDIDGSADASDHTHDGVESSCCLMCHFAVEMPFPALVHNCPASVIEPQGQHAIRQGLLASLERPPRTGSVHTG
jgi:hypothetical protein